LSTAVATRRRIKVRGGHLGPLLCWAVVFADIGTSIYYVPGILYGPYGARSALFVGMTLIVFVLLSLKYAEVAWRYPEGGGVVTVASRALHPFAGLLGGLFILVDYYLTAALSALSGVFYVSYLYPSLTPLATEVTIAALALLGFLNWVGIKESATVSALFAIAAAVAQVLVVGAVALSLGPVGIQHSFQLLVSGPRIPPVLILTGYAAAFLAFSGLESIAQIAPAMRQPRNRVAYRTMAGVIATMALTSPLLTLWSTTLLPAGSDTNQFISLLGAHVAGPLLGVTVAISGSLLLIFASNTAIIGAYHVFIAMTRMGFLPRLLEHRNRWRHTPQWAILLAVGVPVAVVYAAQGNVNLLGDLYAFGLLGAFVLTCGSLDIVRWRETRKRSLLGWLGFGLGVLTTVAVAVAWSVNLVAKPLATEFGGGLTVVGLIVGFATYYRAQNRRPSVFPVSFRADRAAASIREALAGHPAEVLVILPHDPEVAEQVIDAAAERAAGKRAVFLYRGATHLAPSEFLEVADPYLKDHNAQDAFARAESRARKAIRHRRYVYLPGNLRTDLCGDVWRHISPRETIAAEPDQALLPAMAIERVRRHLTKDGTVILHLFTTPLRRVPDETAEVAETA
jgi:amino acid transporter